MYDGLRAFRQRGRWIKRRLLGSYVSLRLRRGVWSRTFPRVGSVRFGDLRRTAPISRYFGYDRGLPVDRYYIEQFLASNAQAIRGHVLEIGHNTYTRSFGSVVIHSDVLHIEEGHPQVTIVADLAHADHVPGDMYDAIICTQTLHLIFDLQAAIHTLHRLLRPGGVLLVTVPGISNVDPGEWSNHWCWSLTTVSARRLMAERFGDELVVRSYGNVLSAVAFLHGLAIGDLAVHELEVNDPAYPLVITVRATKTAQH